MSPPNHSKPALTDCSENNAQVRLLLNPEVERVARYSWPDATVAFRYRTVTKAGESDWSQSVTLIVR